MPILNKNILESHSAKGEMDAFEMCRVFNMGIGMIVIADRESVSKTQESISEETFVIS